MEINGDFKMIKDMIGIEVEYFLVRDNKIIIPPNWHNRDDFPLLGEIRSEPEKTIANVYTSFIKEKMKVTQKLSKKTKLLFSNRERISLETYREAMSKISTDKYNSLNKVKNIYDIDITNYSDQIVKDKKIQGIHASCGLHIHFSSEEKQSRTIEIPKFSSLTIPLTMGKENNSMPMCMNLYTPDGYDEQETITVRASRITQPVIEWIVKQLDEEFFERFTPDKNNRTKYRQPGFYELKPYGFEYRSLPANDTIIAALPEIIDFSFGLLNKL